MPERCPDTFPEDWVDTPVELLDYGIVKLYSDGVRVILGGLSEIDGFATGPPEIETRYPNRDLHYEHGFDEKTWRPSGRSTFIPKGIPEDSEI